MLEGQIHGLTGQNIGHHVFGRAAGYSPAEDDIVRVSVRQLRSKLRDYSESDGCEEDFVLEVPRGGYVPVFKPVERASTPAGGTRPTWVVAAASVCALMALAVAAWFWSENRVLKAAGAATASTLVGELLLKSNQPVYYL